MLASVPFEHIGLMIIHSEDRDTSKQNLKQLTLHIIFQMCQHMPRYQQSYYYYSNDFQLAY